MIVQWLFETWTIIKLSAPWLLVGFFCAGVIHVILPTGFIKKHLKTPGIFSVFKASVYGVPLPLCSCSVIPVGVSLRKEGASKGATASFFVSTPEIGVDSFLLSFFLLGPVLAITRVIATICSAIGVGTLIDHFDDADPEDTEKTENNESSCCHDMDISSVSEGTGTLGSLAVSKIKKVFYFAYVKIFDDISGVLSIGFIGAGLVSVFIPDNLFMDLNLPPIFMMLIMLISALPIYVCATSSTPLVAALLAKGLNPGAAIVFLLAGPATNITTMLTVLRELGKRELVIYLGMIIMVSMFFGIMINQTADFVGFNRFLNNVSHESLSHDHMHGIPGLVLLLMLSFSLMKALVNYMKTKSSGR